MSCAASLASGEPRVRTRQTASSSLFIFLSPTAQIARGVLFHPQYRLPRIAQRPCKRIRKESFFIELLS